MATSLENVIKIWTRWQIQALTLVSLFLQLILIILGSKRKVTTSKFISSLVWCAYLSADWVATVALGILARSFGGGSESEQISSPKNNDSSANLQAFWAPFILLHLGGPDTITAYSLEDNELWLRHLLALVFEVGVASYVFLRSWGTDGSHAALLFIAVPVYIAGIIKYGERTWVLWSSSTKRFRKNLLSDKNVLNKNEWLFLGSGNFIHQAAFMFARLKVLFAGLILEHDEGKKSHEKIQGMEPSEAFKLVEFELGLLYDVLYTKATIAFSRFGVFLRCISSLASVSALVTFSIISRHERYLSVHAVDICVTYLLLVGAAVLEVCALIRLTYSDWTMGCLVEQKQGPLNKVVRNDKRRWSRTIARYNLVNCCTKKETTMFSGCFPRIFEKHRNVVRQKGVDGKLKDLIFNQLKEKTEKNPDCLQKNESCKKLLNYRGDSVLEEMKYLDQLKWSLTDVELDHSILLWHIATDICYHHDIQTKLVDGDAEERSQISRCLSDYMLYLLLIRPNMLPKGIGELRYNIAYLHARNFFVKSDERERDWGKLLESKNQGGDLFYSGCFLAKELQEFNNILGCKAKWEMMNRVWVEMVMYAAAHCGWKVHGEQLRKGGELLTHVCVLMAHFGLSEQYHDWRLYVTQGRGGGADTDGGGLRSWCPKKFRFNFFISKRNFRSNIFNVFS